jgi:hypothetical protein
VVGRGHPLTPENLRIDRREQRWRCLQCAPAPRHFAVDMVALRENLHDRTVWRVGADEQGRDDRVRADLAGAGSYSSSAAPRIAPLCNMIASPAILMRRRR